MNISKLEYVKMVNYHALAGHTLKYCHDKVDEILKLNGITVSDEPEVKPMTLAEFNDVWRLDLAETVRELKKRGLVIA